MTGAWTNDTPVQERYGQLELLEQKWATDLRNTPDEVAGHTAPLTVAQFTALGIMVRELPEDLQQTFAGSYIWSERGNVLDTWQSVARNMASMGVRFVYNRQANIIST